MEPLRQESRLISKVSTGCIPTCARKECDNFPYLHIWLGLRLGMHNHSSTDIYIYIYIYSTKCIEQCMQVIQAWEFLVPRLLPGRKMGREPGRSDHVPCDILCVVCVILMIELQPTQSVLSVTSGTLALLEFSMSL